MKVENLFKKGKIYRGTDMGAKNYPTPGRTKWLDQAYELVPERRSLLQRPNGDPEKEENRNLIVDLLTRHKEQKESDFLQQRLEQIQADSYYLQGRYSSRTFHSGIEFNHEPQNNFDLFSLSIGILTRNF